MSSKTLAISKSLSDDAILTELGQRLSRYRINAKLTQQALADMAGISKSTLERIEAGAPSQLPNLIRVLRVLDMLPALESAIPALAPRPMDLLRNQRKPPQRVRPRQTRQHAPASGSANSANSANSAKSTNSAKSPDTFDQESANKSQATKPWVWGDERK